MELTKQSHEPGRAGADWRSDRREGQVDADGSKGYAAIAQALERHVVDGRHAPGERLTERAVMARFGCTNAAAREVLHILEMSGAIHLTSRRGARIVDERFGKSDAILETWHCLLGLFTSELRAGGTSLPMPPLSTIAGEAPYDRFVALRGWLCDAGRATENEKLATMLTRTAMHLFIVAPDKTDALFRGSEDEHA